jgi:ketosteroid isomerase-like protein
MHKLPLTAAICFVSVLMSLSAMADHHGIEKGNRKAVDRSTEDADLHAAIKAFDRAYANNDVELYFSLYADNATVYVGGGERVDMAAYHELWTALMAAGGGVERNDMSDLKVQVMPGGDVAGGASGGELAAE